MPTLSNILPFGKRTSTAHIPVAHPEDYPVILFALDCTNPLSHDEEQIAMGVKQFGIWCEGRGLPFKVLKGKEEGRMAETIIEMFEGDFCKGAVASIWCQGQERFIRLSGTIHNSKDEDCGFRIASEQRYSPITWTPENIKELGRWEAVPRRIALANDAWTLDPNAWASCGLTGDDAGQYWIIRSKKANHGLGDAMKAGGGLKPDPWAPQPPAKHGDGGPSHGLGWRFKLTWNGRLVCHGYGTAVMAYETIRNAADQCVGTNLVPTLDSILALTERGQKRSGQFHDKGIPGIMEWSVSKL